ncbi:DUF305 domain-containing protein [Micromonospora globbae]|uniref:DUF305 domain-containing protein n=1 Tax=Micromonospora globbae TaxID=1894969 RepID=UPI00343706A3
MKKGFKYGAAATAIGVLLSGPAAAQAARPWTDNGGPSKVQDERRAPVHATPMRTSPTAYEFGETLATLEGRELEITFLAEIIPHHQAAIVMSELELERGESPNIRTQAENIIANQRHQIEQFTRWLDEWYGLTPEEAADEAPEEAQREMAALERETEQMIEELRETPEGPGFDVAFVERMIPHHQAGIIEFLEPQSRAPHAQLRVAATSGIVTQESQVADFRTWLSGRK